jgi:ribosomal protein S18 acetylase RimI-like enzyme
METPVEYRFATEEDVPALARMNHELIRDEGHRNPMSLVELEDRMADWIDDDHEAVVFIRDGVEVGYALYRFEPDWVYVRQFYVDPKCRRSGVGRAALAWLRKHPWQNELRVRLEVLVGNTMGIAFWRSCGFSDYALTMESEPSESPSNDGDSLKEPAPRHCEE